MMKIAALAFSFLSKLGGAQIFTYNLLQRLAAKGHDVSLYIPDSEYDLTRELLERLPYPVRPLLWRTNGFFNRMPWLLGWRIRGLQRKHGYDVWQIIGAYPAGVVGAFLAGRVPLVLRSHGDDIQKDAALNYGLRLDPAKETRIADAVRRMDRLVAITQTVSDCYRELGADESKIVEIPNGVSIERFSKQSGRAETRKKLGLQDGELLILTVGRYHHKKGFDIIPAVAAGLKEKGIRFTWLVVGSGSDALSGEIERRGMQECVLCQPGIGVVDAKDSTEGFELPPAELVSLYQAADIFALPSLLETFGRVLIEAMAAGVPVVTTDAPGCRDVVEKDVTGLVAPAGDADAFSGALLQLAEDAALREKLAARARAAVRRYDWDTVVDAYEKLYAELAG